MHVFIFEILKFPDFRFSDFQIFSFQILRFSDFDISLAQNLFLFFTSTDVFRDYYVHINPLVAIDRG